MTPIPVLVLDTSTPAVTAAVAGVSPTLAMVLQARRVVDARAHGEQLAPLIHQCLAAAGLAPGQLGAIVAGIGPGPYTGLRVGLVTAAAMGQALGIPTYGVCSLDGLGALTTGVTLVATDARRKEVYWAVYRDGVRVTEPAVDKPSLSLVAGLGVTTVVGEGASLHDWGLPVAEPRYPSPEAVVAVAAPRVIAGAPSEILTPLYLRRPDATPRVGA